MVLSVFAKAAAFALLVEAVRKLNLVPGIRKQNSDDMMVTGKEASSSSSEPKKRFEVKKVTIRSAALVCACVYCFSFFFLCSGTQWHCGHGVRFGRVLVGSR